jgi:hypothetical protein
MSLLLLVILANSGECLDLGHRVLPVLEELPGGREMIRIVDSIQGAPHVADALGRHVGAAQELELDLASSGVESVGLEGRLILRDAVVGEDERCAIEVIGRDHVAAPRKCRVAVPFHQDGTGRRQLEGRRGFLTVLDRRFPRALQRFQAFESWSSIDFG